MGCRSCAVGRGPISDLRALEEEEEEEEEEEDDDEEEEEEKKMWVS